MRATGILVAVLLCAACNEPKYQGRPLSAWAYDLDSERDYDRRAGCEAMGKIGPPAAVHIEKMIELLEDVNEGVQAFCASSLGQVGPSAQAPLEEVLARPEPLLKLHAATALIAMDPGHKGAQDALVAQTTGIGNAELAKQAQEVVIRQGAAAVPWLVPKLGDTYAPVRLQVLETLRKMDSKAVAASEPIMKMITEDKSKEVRIKAIKTLAQIGKPEVIEPLLRKETDNPDDDVATAAAFMLKHIGAYKSASGNEGVPD